MYELDGSTQATQCISVVIPVCQCNCDSPRTLCLPAYPQHPSVKVSVYCDNPEIIPGLCACLSKTLLCRNITVRQCNCDSPGIIPELCACLATAPLCQSIPVGQ